MPAIKKGHVQVLISTKGSENLEFLNQMNIQSDAVVGNQNGKNEKRQTKIGNNNIKVICSDTLGVSNNRNITLKNADCEYCLLSDDDVTFVDNYPQIIINGFEKYPEADVLIFNLHEKPVNRYVIKEKIKIHKLNYAKFGAVRIAFRLKSIYKNKIIFDKRFGPGSKISIGEDTIFLYDCLKAGLKIYGLPDYILTLNDNRESWWFHGYEKNYFVNKGKLYERIYGQLSLIMIMQDAVRHARDYGKSSYQTIQWMNYGRKFYRKNGK